MTAARVVLVPLVDECLIGGSVQGTQLDVARCEDSHSEVRFGVRLVQRGDDYEGSFDRPNS